MSTTDQGWSPQDLDRIGGAEELELATRRDDGSLSTFTIMWVVRAGDDLYVRSARGPAGAWWRRALRHGEGVVRAGGGEREVTFEHLAAGNAAHPAIDAAYHAKYDRYGPRIVGSVVGPSAAQVTLRLLPADRG
ncbi:hypothetical protein SGUI_1589 [Serinicoccus hydrothermalis]|uniref:DUF2255 family protein n=1 Tax=Serinicoccus hydrothermalis TaxID=1758689 RepID=A0A1B1NC84_9MICO|nr:DUF2255 family protein [Serinicoccus hydrothermalis]ANS78985.1 hypothetical protein SGUI_1589 [Serinicoccus hydrothermalis]